MWGSWCVAQRGCAASQRTGGSVGVGGAAAVQHAAVVATRRHQHTDAHHLLQERHEGRVLCAGDRRRWCSCRCRCRYCRCCQLRSQRRRLVHQCRLCVCRVGDGNVWGERIRTCFRYTKALIRTTRRRHRCCSGEGAHQRVGAHQHLGHLAVVAAVQHRLQPRHLAAQIAEQLVLCCGEWAGV